MSNTSKITFIIALIFALCAAAGFAFLLLGVQAQSAELQTQIETMTKEQIQQRTFQNLEHTLEETAVERQQLKGYFLQNESESIDLLDLIEQAAPQAGVVLTTESINVVEDPADETPWVQVAFAISGPRERVENFIQLLEAIPYVSRLTQLQLSMVTDTEWNASVTIQVRLLDYEE